MLRLADSTPWRDEATELAQRVRAGERVGVRAVVGRDRLVSSVVRLLEGDAVHVPVPSGPDQVERLLLGVATALGPDATSSMDEVLRRSPDDLSPALNALSDEIAGRRLVVDGWDAVVAGKLEPELGRALAPRLDQVRAWLRASAALIAANTAWPPTPKVQSLTGPPVELVNGAVQDTRGRWEQFEHDPVAYVLALTALALGASDEDLEGATPDLLRERVAEMLPASTLALLHRLGVHGRPLPRRLLETESGTSGAVSLGLDLGLWTEGPEGLVVEPSWADAFVARLPASLRTRIHRDLAQLFLEDFRLDDPSVARRAVSVLEAHRHLVGAGQTDRAREYARYGGALLIEAARELSVGRDFTGAATLYGQVVTAAERGEMPVPRRLRAYARHYLHYNRARATPREDLLTTERGYRAALEDWPENALFWSRLIRVDCYQERVTTALADLTQAAVQVPPHPLKSTFLVARTVRGLLERDRIVEAIRIWGDYRADTPFAHDVQDRLRARLARGWTTGRLAVDSERTLVLTRPVDVRVVGHGARWSAELPTLSAFADGRSPLEALGAVVDQVRNEVRRLVRAYTSDLGPRDRMRKRLLLGAVDVVTSGLDGAKLDSYWFFGTLHRDDQGALWLRTGGERDLQFEVPVDLARETVVDDLPHLARVSTDEHGVPTGPVLELEPGFRGTDDDLWDAWQRRADGG